MPPEAAAFPRLQKIKVTLDKQNHLIFEAERERNKLEIELSDLKGLARCYPAFYLVLNHTAFNQIKKRHSINYSDGFYIGLLYAVPLVLS